MLLASLHGKHESAAAFGVCRHAYEATGHFAHEVFLAAQVTDVRPAAGERQTEALAVAAGDVCAPFAGRAQRGEVGGHGVYGEERFVGVAVVGNAFEVFHDAVVVGLRQQHACHVAFLHGGFKEILVGHAVFLGNGLQVHAVVVRVGFHHAQHVGGEG